MANPILYWALDTLEETQTIDKTTNKLNGTVAGGIAKVEDEKFGSCIQFDGQSGSITVPDNEALQLKQYTAEVWIKPEKPVQETQEWAGILGKPGRNYNIWLNYKNSYIHHRFELTDDKNAGVPDDYYEFIWGEWYHIAITNDGQTACTYINGICQKQVSLTKELVIEKQQFIVGRSLDGNNNEYYKGCMAHLRLYDQALTAQEIEGDILADTSYGTSYRTSYERLKTLGMTFEEANKLLNKDGGKLNSALAIASISQENFVNKTVDILNKDKAEKIHQKATQLTTGSIVILANAMQVSSPRLQTTPHNNTTALHENFKSFPSYEQLFGSLDYLQCEPCQSIFSPSAYFVNLMQIVDKYITQPNKGNNGFVGLGDRRPDLAQIPLTCDNTNDTVPYTQIVNDVLVEKLKRDTGDDVFKHLATAKYPHNLPFNLYLEQIRLYLGHLNITPADIYETFQSQDITFQSQDITWAREYLQLSPEEYDLITKPNADAKDLSQRYGVDVSQPNLGGLTQKDTFLKQTGLSWQELHNLLYQNLSLAEIKAGIFRQFYINKNLSDSKYLNLNDNGEIENLNLNTLDRCDRFLRLARRLGWSFADLDWVLTSINATEIDEQAIQKIAQIKRIQTQTKLSLDVLCSFWYKMKTIGKGDKLNRPQDLFNRVFNNPLILQGQERFQPDDQNKTQWKSQASRLRAALQLSDKDLTEIVKVFFKESPTLTIANLSTFFRISQILKLLNLQVGEFKLLLQLIDVSVNSDKLEIDQLNQILTFAKWLKVSGFSLYELDYIIEGTIYPHVEIFVAESKIANLMQSLWQQVNINSLPMTDIQLPTTNNGATQTNNKNLVSEINEKVASIFGIQPGLFSALAQFYPSNESSSNDLPDYLPDYLNLLLNEVKQESDGWNNILSFWAFISRTYLLVSKLGLTEPELTSIITYPSAYNITNLGGLTGLETIQRLHSFKKELVPIFNKAEGGVLKYFEDPTVENLAKFTGWDQEQIKPTQYKNEEQIKATEYKIASVEDLLRLKQFFDLCHTIGCNIEFLRDLSDLLANSTEENDWNNYQNLANSTFSFVKSKYTHEEWEKVFAKLNGTLEERKCQILTDFALWKLNKENPRQLSEYLLLDVEMTSCACNSKIQLATLSLQTYLQRCRMGLEMGVTQVDIPPVWWDWIMNYRVWEANRKVFLYPENYIDPSLRKSVSPIFKELQDELLQSEITAETVEDAYRNYFDKFAELAKLQIVDSCRYSVITPKSPDPIDTLFIFAKTLTQPHTFYYRRCERPADKNPSWGYWEKIDLQINSDYLAPIYAFERLFVFWVETKEITKSKDNSSTDKVTTTQDKVTTTQDKVTTTQATIKYSFLTHSQKWVAPQTLVADEDVSALSMSANQEVFWKQVYPSLLAEAENKKIVVCFGGLPTLALTEKKLKLDALNSALAELNSAIAELNSAQQTLNSAVALFSAQQYEPNCVMVTLNPALTALNSALTALNSAAALISAQYELIFARDALISGRDELYSVLVALIGFLSVAAPTQNPLNDAINKLNSIIDQDIRNQLISAQNALSQPFFPYFFQISIIAEDLLAEKPEKPGYPLNLQLPSIKSLQSAQNFNTCSIKNFTPIKNEPKGFIFQCRNEFLSTLDIDQNNQLTRLTTSTIQQFSRILFTQGLNGLLSLESQQILESTFLNIDNKLDFNGAYGAYFWEIFFHIPFLIADTLNHHQRYDEARQWYQYIFNPTIPGTDKDRFWRFLPFQGHTPEKLIDIWFLGT
ncbi:MAG: neuraminidase-like domain-containing protein [Gloeotrichia echinulata HAB0833]